ncbi:DUF7689 domain-containing protein [Baaleninema sp.]|uniref:DUF7689 domain-containing protein n=1 Tax=Baaleninema sp. TaxID=3101197 RepID=UPI003D05E34F
MKEEDNEPIGNYIWRTQVREELEKLFPNLASTGYRLTSQDTIEYNCVAWAVGRQDEWWWLDELGESYWPPEVERELTIDSFISVFKKIGYEVCNDENFEEGFQKIAIYAQPNGEPTHVARQLKEDCWTSKIGSLEDIEHRLEGLNSMEYGKAEVFMKLKN